MKNNKEILIINTGGTFNKTYDELTGNLIIKEKDNYIKEIIIRTKITNQKIKGLIYKDSLDITLQDRKELLSYIKKSSYKKILLIHGTDTMDKTAKYLQKYIHNKIIVLTGAMKPYSIDKVEATANFMCGYGYLLNCKKNNIYIAMHGMVKKHNKIYKNRDLGIFECQ